MNQQDHQRTVLIKQQPNPPAGPSQAAETLTGQVAAKNASVASEPPPHRPAAEAMAFCAEAMHLHRTPLLLSAQGHLSV